LSELSSGGDKMIRLFSMTINPDILRLTKWGIILVNGG
jgi:hypothetical protein